MREFTPPLILRLRLKSVPSLPGGEFLCYAGLKSKEIGQIFCEVRMGSGVWDLKG
jgi:hypothetical protein